MAVCFKKSRTSCSTSPINVAADANRNVLPAAATISQDAAETVRIVASSKADTIAASASSLGNGRYDKLEIKEATTASIHTVLPLGELPSQKNTTCSEIETSLASSADENSCGPSPSFYSSTDTDHLLLSSSVTHRPICTFPGPNLTLEAVFPKQHSQSDSQVATDIEVSDNGEPLSDRVLPAPPPKCGRLDLYTASFTNESEKTHSVPRADGTAPFEKADSADRHRSPSTGSVTESDEAEEAPVVPGGGKARPGSVLPSSLDLSAVSADLRDKQEQPLRQTPTATAETPSTVTSSSSNGCASASCSPASSPPSETADVFPPSGLSSSAPDSHPPAAAQGCCAKAGSPCTLSPCKDFFGSSAPVATPCALSPSGPSRVSFVPLPCASPCLPSGPHSSQSRLQQSSILEPGAKEDLLTTGSVIGAADRERISAVEDRNRLCSEPHCCPREDTFPASVSQDVRSPTTDPRASIPWQSNGHAVLEEREQTTSTTDGTGSAVNEKEQEQGSEPSARDTADADALHSEVGGTSIRQKVVKHPPDESALTTQHYDETSRLPVQLSKVMSPITCLVRRSLLQPAADYAPGGPLDMAGVGSRAPLFPCKGDGSLSKPPSDLGVTAGVLGARGDVPVRPETPAAVGTPEVLRRAGPPIETGSRRKTQPQGNPTNVSPEVTLARSASSDRSTAGGKSCVAGFPLTAGGINKARSPCGRGGEESSASTLQVRCLLAASLRSIFKMLIKRVTRQQRQRVSRFSQERGQDFPGDWRGIKRRRLNLNSCQVSELSSASCGYRTRTFLPGDATLGACFGRRGTHVDVGARAGAQAHQTNGSEEELCIPRGPTRMRRQAESLQRQPSACTTAAHGQNIFTSLTGNSRHDVLWQLQSSDRQNAAWAAAANLLQRKTAMKEAQHDPASQKALSHLSAAGSDDSNVLLCRAFEKLQPDPEIDAFSYTDSASRAHHRDRAGPLAEAATSSRTFPEMVPCAAFSVLSARRRLSSSAAPRVGTAASLALHDYREVEAEANKRGATFAFNRSRGSSADGLSVRNGSAAKLPGTSTNSSVTNVENEFPGPFTSRLGGSCLSPPAFDSACRQAVSFCCRSRGSGVQGCCCPRGAELDSLQETAAHAEQQLLAAYRECFLLLTAAERKEELYIFEFVLLGGTCQNETLWPGGQTEALVQNNPPSIVFDQQQPLSQQLHGHGHGAGHRKGSLRSSADGSGATGAPSAAPYLRKGPDEDLLASKDACTQKEWMRSANAGSMGKATQHVVERRGNARSASTEGVSATEIEAEATWKRRRQIALRPDKWEAKKVHYVLAALDGLRDAWRQGSSNTRAKAQILESLFTPQPQGLQQRALPLVQQPRVTGFTQLVLPQNSLRQSWLQKYFDIRPVPNSDRSSAGRKGAESAACKTTPLSCSRETENLGGSNSAGRNAPVSPLTGLLSLVQSKPPCCLCISDGRPRNSGCFSQARRSERCAQACCCGNSLCRHPSTSFRGSVSTRTCLHASSSARHTSYKGGKGCLHGAKETLSCDPSKSGQPGSRAEPTTHHPSDTQASGVTTASSGRKRPFPVTADTQLSELSFSHLLPEGVYQQVELQQHGSYQLKRSNALTSDSSPQTVDSTVVEEANKCIFSCPATEAVDRRVVERAGPTGTGSTGCTEPLEGSSFNLSQGDCMAITENVRELRRGKVKSSVTECSHKGRGKDVYKKPRPAVFSRRVLLQRRLQRHVGGTSHATATSDTEVDATPDIVISDQLKKKGVVHTTRPPVETDVGGTPDVARQAPLRWNGKERDVPEVRWQSSASEAAGQIKNGLVRTDPERDLGRPSIGEKCSRNGTSRPTGSSHGALLIQACSSESGSSDEVTLDSEQGNEDGRAFTGRTRRTSGAGSNVAAGECLTRALSGSGVAVLNTPHVPPVRDLLETACDDSSIVKATLSDNALDVATQDGLAASAQTPTSARALTVSAEALQEESLPSGPQNSTNTRGASTCCTVTPSKEGPAKETAKGMLRAKGPAESTASMSALQHAAMRTTRHNKTKQPGVFQFTRGPKRFWAASWYADGHPGWKAFSVEKWGNREAFERARRAYEEKVPRLPVAEASSTHQGSHDLVDPQAMGRDILCWRRLAQEKEESIECRRDLQKARLTAEQKITLPDVIPTQAFSCETASSSIGGKEGKPEASASPVTSLSRFFVSAPAEDVSIQCAQKADEAILHSANGSSSTRSASFEAGTSVSVPYKKELEQVKASAGGSGPQVSEALLSELWNSCSGGGGGLSLIAASSGKEVSPATYGSSSSSRFDLAPPTFTESPRSLAQHRRRSTSGRRRERLRRGLEQLLLSSTQAANEGEECRGAETEPRTHDKERKFLPHTQQMHQMMGHGLQGTSLPADAYALLSPTAFLSLTPENEDVTAQLLLVSPEDEMTQDQGKHL